MSYDHSNHHDREMMDDKEEQCPDCWEMGSDCICEEVSQLKDMWDMMALQMKLQSKEQERRWGTTTYCNYVVREGIVLGWENIPLRALKGCDPDVLIAALKEASQ